MVYALKDLNQKCSSKLVFKTAMGSRVALKRVALLSATPKLRSAKGVPLILLRLSGNRSGTQYFSDF